VTARVQAPREPGAVLAEPPLDQVGDRLRSNRRTLEQADLSILGRLLSDLRLQARQLASQAAAEYLRAAGEPLPPSARPGYWLLSGHQPELFHPGVWVKNFALNGLVQAHGGTALNLVVDTDLAKTADLKVPTWEGDEALPEAPPERVYRANVPFDRWRKEAPFEERMVEDEELFSSLPERVAPLVRGWPFASLLPKFWNDVRHASAWSGLLGERLVSARRTWERHWGCHNWEVPVSRLCRTEPFAWFACHVLSEAPRFHALYNACVRDYRRANGIKNHLHPVPDLAAEGDWLEVPFWGWQRDQHQRGRLMVRRDGSLLRLRLGDNQLPAIPVQSTDAVAAWLDFERQGIKLRSRALTTTLFARLFLADLFIHGIGGAKYDEITDALLRRFYGLEPPRYLVLSATLHLPLPSYSARAAQVYELEREVRDLRCNPQRHLEEASDGEDLTRLAAEKNDWIGRQPPSHRGRRERYHALRALTERMRPFLSDTVRRRQLGWEEAQVQMRANAILQRRDYAFCLFPEAMLRDFCTRFLTWPSG
jgi:hypothetical protein